MSQPSSLKPSGRRSAAAAGRSAGAAGRSAGGDVRELVTRAGVDPAQIDDVVAGCVTQTGEQGMNIARAAALIAASRLKSRERRSIVSVARASRRSTSPPRA